MKKKEKFSGAEIIRELQEEIYMRERVYSRKVKQGTMSTHTKLRRIALIREAINRLRKLEKIESEIEANQTEIELYPKPRRF